MRTTTRPHLLARAAAAPIAALLMFGMLPASASAEPSTPAAPSTTSPAPATTTAPTTRPPATPTVVPSVPPTVPPTVTRPTTTTPAPSTTTTTPPQGPPGRLTVGAVRLVDERGATVPGATAFVQGCSGGPGASLADGGATTVTGQCVRAQVDRVPTNWRVISPPSQTVTTSSGRAEFRFVFQRGGIVPPTSTTPPPAGGVRFALNARDRSGNGVPSEYAVYACDSSRPLGGARTDRGGNGGGAFPGDCLTVVPVSWPRECVLVGPHMYARVVGNGVNRLNFTYKCGGQNPPGTVETNGTLVKTDRITGAPLGGASFLISGCESGESVRSVTTGDNGIAAFSLPPGCYRATETVAPAGYVRDTTTVAFQVHLTPQFQVRVTNAKITAGPVVRNPVVRVPISSIPSGRTA